MPMTTDERERLVLDHMPLVHALARRYANRGEPLEELVQAGAVGLVKAVDRFDSARGTELAGFATPSILGEIRRHFRDTTWSLHVPRAVSENRSRVVRVRDDLATREGHIPGVDEIAAEAGLTEEETVEALEAGAARSTASLSQIPAEDDDGATIIPGEVDPGFEAAEARADLAEGLGELPARERVILHLRFEEDLTQSEIAERIGISQMHVSRLIRASLRDLRGTAAARRERARRARTQGGARRRVAGAH